MKRTEALYKNLKERDSKATHNQSVFESYGVETRVYGDRGYPVAGLGGGGGGTGGKRRFRGGPRVGGDLGSTDPRLNPCSGDQNLMLLRTVSFMQIPY